MAVPKVLVKTPQNLNFNVSTHLTDLQASIFHHWTCFTEFLGFFILCHKKEEFLNIQIDSMMRTVFLDLLITLSLKLILWLLIVQVIKMVVSQL